MAASVSILTRPQTRLPHQVSLLWSYALTKNTFINHVIWGLGGLTLGTSLALLVSRNWIPEWIGATGTWFGAVATVLTLLWVVRSFRSHQAERENSRLAERDKEVAALMISRKLATYPSR